MARGYRQLSPGDYVYRHTVSMFELEYKVHDLYITEDLRVVGVWVKQTEGMRAGDLVSWSFDAMDADADGTRWDGDAHKVVDAFGRTVRRASFDRMVRENQPRLRHMAQEREAHSKREAMRGV